MRLSILHRYTALLLALLCAGISPPVLAESGAYRIELVVFQYPNDDHAPEDVAVMDAFPGAFPLDAPRAVFLQEDPAPLGVMSDLMRDAWRRLERQADYQPLLYLNWEQSRIDYQPPVRVHDGELLFERLWFPGDRAWIDMEQADFLAPYRQSFYHLDGTAQLRRTRFLHLELDLRLRAGLLEPETTEAAEPGLSPLQPPTTATLFVDPLAAMPLRVPQPVPAIPGAREFRLHESRQIKTEEINYFDTPTLGVLARITATAGE